MVYKIIWRYQQIQQIRKIKKMYRKICQFFYTQQTLYGDIQAPQRVIFFHIIPYQGTILDHLGTNKIKSVLLQNPCYDWVFELWEQREQLFINLDIYNTETH